MERGPRPGPERVQKAPKYGEYQSVSVTRKFVSFRPTKSVSIHESGHAVASIESGSDIIYSTIVRQGNALGTTVPVRITPAATGAGAITDGNGTGQDEGVANYIGVSWGQAKAEASAVLAGKELEVEAVASALEDKGTIFQADVNEAYREADKARKGIATVEVVLIDNSGRKTEYQTETAQSVDEIIDEMEERLRDEDMLVGV